MREAVALSGLEGLGAPRVLRFGRLPRTDRPFLVRELVEGRSLLELYEDGADPAKCLEAIALAADQLTVLHRASPFTVTSSRPISSSAPTARRRSSTLGWPRPGKKVARRPRA